MEEKKPRERRKTILSISSRMRRSLMSVSKKCISTHESNDWKITIGFHRPWDHRNKLLTALGDQYPARSYKVVRIDDDDGRVISVTDRVLPAISE